MSDMKLQRAEFDAADEFAKRLRALNQTPIVDDDYPAVRHRYESALAQLIAGMKANGRFGKGNRYGLSHG
jgi:protoporphyrinogen oxidase